MGHLPVALVCFRVVIDEWCQAEWEEESDELLSVHSDRCHLIGVNYFRPFRGTSSAKSTPRWRLALGKKGASGSHASGTRIGRSLKEKNGVDQEEKE